MYIHILYRPPPLPLSLNLNGEASAQDVTEELVRKLAHLGHRGNTLHGCKNFEPRHFFIFAIFARLQNSNGEAI